MHVPERIFLILVALMMILAGCSGEEQSEPPEQKSIVKKSINRPKPKKAEVLPPVKEPEPPTTLNEAGKTEMPSLETGKRIEEKQIKKEENKGYYITKRDDSLSKIALRGDIYGDPLKWPIIYRLNQSILHQVGSSENAPHEKLPAGIRLKVIKPDEAKKVLKTRPENYWIINVLSSTRMEKIVPNTIKLIENGYPVYLTQARIDGKNWTRIRIGFFENKRDADLEGKKIRELMNLPEIWVTQTDKSEFEEFGGY